MQNLNSSNYELLEVKANGGFGYIVTAYDKENDKRVAIKCTHKKYLISSREKQILIQLRDSPNIVKLLDVFYTNGQDGIFQHLVLEYFEKNLREYMFSFAQKKINIPLETIKTIISKILYGLNSCHSRKIIHRDLKPENVLINERNQNMIIKLCDFGSAKILEENEYSTPLVVAECYRAPELILSQYNYDEKIDIFTAGCILAELFKGSTLFPMNTKGGNLWEIMNVLGDPGVEYFTSLYDNIQAVEGVDNIVNYFKTGEYKNYFYGNIINLTDEIDPKGVYEKNEVENAVDLIKKMIDWDPKKRPSAMECLQHSFFMTN